MDGMNPSVADQLVLRALSRSGADGLTLAALHATVAVDPESDALQTFVAEISASLVRLLMSGEVTVERSGDTTVYMLRAHEVARGAVA